MLMTETSGAGRQALDRVVADLRALSEDIESCAVLSGTGPPLLLARFGGR